MKGVYYAIGISYIVYYTANIVYDLFLKKEKRNDDNIIEEISLADLSEENVKHVEIEDVENVSTPNSFQEKIALENSDEQEAVNIEELRKRFEAEESLDAEKNKNATAAPSTISKLDVMSFLNDADTNVQLVDTIEGYKTYTIKNF